MTNCETLRFWRLQLAKFFVSLQDHSLYLKKQQKIIEKYFLDAIKSQKSKILVIGNLLNF